MKNLIRKKWKLITAVIVGLLILSGWLFNRSQASKVELVFVKPERKNLIKTLELSGVVDAKEKVRLRFLAGGKLTYLGVKEGSLVKKWQTIASIDQRLLQKQLEQQLNNYMEQRWNYEQYRDDNLENSDGTNRPDPNLATRRQGDIEQWNLENSVLNVEMQDISVKNAALTTPIEGIVTYAPAAVAGMQLTAADYFEIINPKTFVFKAVVDELDIASVKLAQNATIKLDAYSDEAIDSTISYISFSSQQTTTGTVFVIELPLINSDANQQLRLGMNGNAVITLQQKNDVLSIPIGATREVDGKIMVDVRNGTNSYEPREITVGLETSDEVEVLSGLTGQEEVLLPN